MKWKDVSKELPEDMQEVLFANVNIKDMHGNSVKPNVVTGYYLCRGVFRSWLSTDNFYPTHWMKLPDPPIQK